MVSARAIRNAGLAGFLASVFTACSPQAGEDSGQAGAYCDRACLTGFMDAYLRSLSANSPRSAPFAEDVRFTENGQVLALGDGLWGTVHALGNYRNDFVDPGSGQIASFVTLEEGEGQSTLTARLRVEKGVITEIETLVARPDLGASVGGGADRLNALGKPQDIWNEIVPEPSRMSRSQLREVADSYFTGLQGNDGKGDYRFADDCDRLENGFRTTNQTEKLPLPGVSQGEGEQPFAYEYMRLGCKAQFQLGYYRFLDRIRDRRFPIIDPERGVVFTFVAFDHSGTVRNVTLTDGREVQPGLDRPFTWVMGEAFKIEGGNIRRIEAVMNAVPYGMPPNWPADRGASVQ